MTSHRKKVPSRLLAAAAFAMFTQCAMAQSAPPTPPLPGNGPPPREGGGAQGRPPRLERGDRPERSENAQPVAVTGTLSDFNLGPRGEPDGLLLSGEGGRVTQVNMPPGLAAMIMQSVKAGDAINAMAEPLLSMPDHPVYELVSIKVKDQEIRAPRREDAKQAKVEGTIKRLNYGRDGRVNGAVLETGELVTVGPEAAEKAKLAMGQKLTAEGMQMPIPGGKSVVHARTVNGIEAGPLVGGPRGEGPGPGGPRALGHGRGRDGGPGGQGQGIRPPAGPEGAEAPPPPKP